MSVAVSLILLFSLVPQINSECCSSPYGGCGGVGSCDLFCCNCDGGCPKGYGDRFKRTPIQMQDHFASFDTDADGFISLGEALLREKKSVPEHVLAMEQFAAIDEDGDSRVSYAEFEKHA